MIERIHLSILREVHSQGSLTAAAKTLHLTQSALSHAIKKLELRIGTELWVKEGRNIRLTQAGDYLLAAANRLIPQLEHLDNNLQRYANGEKGSLQIGMECHPCYRWLLKVIENYLLEWPCIDIDVKQQFQFGGMAALFSYDIDLLVTPDPLYKKGVTFFPVFDYEQVLVLNRDHPLAKKSYINPSDLNEETLFTYPVDIERLDIYSEFLIPANCSPKKQKHIEATEIMLQMVAVGRGVTALPKWLVEEYQDKLSLTWVRLGKNGISKQIHLGIRDSAKVNQHTQAFLTLAKNAI